ncbi:MAG: insulinase family protein [Acidobacteriota bacterium]|nr:insulinase family protein [Acidobacteriota bacterium]
MAIFQSLLPTRKHDDNRRRRHQRTGSRPNGEKLLGRRKAGDYKQKIAVEPAQKESRKQHIEWASQTLPFVAVAYRAPAFSETDKDKAALDLMAAIAFGENSDVFQKLVLQEQKAVFVSPEFDNHIDPELFSVWAQVKDEKDLNYVRDEIIKTYDKFTKELIPAKQLDETRSRLRYGFSMAMNSNDAIAGTLARFIALRRSPETIDKVFAMYDSITPADIRQAAEKYFKQTNQTVVTLATKK